MGKILIIYDSLTGNVKRFINKLPNNFECCHISDYDGTSYYILITYTINFGKVPNSTQKFLNENGLNILGISSSGNKVWGKSYGNAANIISEKYSVPLISKFELQGTEDDIQYFIERIGKILNE